MAIDIIVGDGKYHYMFHGGTSEVFRHGERWRNTTGDGFILAMAQRIEELEEALKIRRAFRRCPHCSADIQNGLAHEKTCEYHRVEEIR